MSHIANAILGLAFFFANARSRIPAYTVKDNGVTFEFVNPSKTESKAFDKETYEDCQLFLRGYSNPIKIDISETTEEIEKDPRYDLIPSSRYKNFMKQSVIEEAFFAEGFKIDKIFYMVIAILAAQMIFSMIIIFMVS